MVTLTLLQQKEIISLESGQRMGAVIDLEIDVDRGRITHIIVGTKNNFSNLFNKPEELIIPWSKIEIFGMDVILVKDVKLEDE